MKHFHVAAGILRDCDGRVLVAERLSGDALHGLWEFPGGKIDADESAADALKRELHEELGITAGSMQPFMELHHEYPDRKVELQFFVVCDWQGEPQGLEGQRLRWVATQQLDELPLLPADAPVVVRLKALQEPATAGDN